MATQGQWVIRGFEGFRSGSFENAGQNLYVSRGGILQRIHHFDLSADGRLDILICNSQDHWERPPAYVYSDVFGGASRVELPSDGALSGVLVDLNGDGCEDLVLAMGYNGSRTDLNALIYWGSPEGFGERYLSVVPAPGATSVTAGDFNGNGRMDLAFAAAGKVRVFSQTELLFEPKRFQDLEIPASQFCGGDLDGDGCADLYVLPGDGRPRVYWGGPQGLDADRFTQVPADLAPATSPVDRITAATEQVVDARPLPGVVRLDGTAHLFVAETQRVLLVPVNADRSLGTPLSLACPGALAVAAGDLDGDGWPDLVVASRGVSEGQECSRVYWGGAQGFSDERWTALPTSRACDVAVGDLDGDGRDEAVVCQDHTDISFTFHSLALDFGPDRTLAQRVELESHDAPRVLVGRDAAGGEPGVVLVNRRARGSIGDVDPVVYFGGEDGFTPARSHRFRGRDAVDAVCCDLNDDGLVDVVLANCSENAVHLDPGSFIFYRRPEGFGYEPDVALPTTRAHGVCCADLNRNGYLDLAVCGFNNPEVLVFSGGPEGFDMQTPQRIRLEVDAVVYKEPRWMHLADLNNDGWLDLVIPQTLDDRSLILWGGPEGFSIERRQMLGVVRGACARTADLTGNGWLDLIVGGHAPSPHDPHDSFVYVYWNGPDGLREDRRTVLPSKAVNALALADFNNDGHTDLFICSYHDSRERDIDSYIYWGGQGGEFSAERRTRLFTHSASGCIAADFNGDGWVDLAVAYHKVESDHRGYSQVWWNGPEGFRADRVTTLPSQGPHGMIAVEPGNQRDRGPEECWVSPPHRLPEGARMTGVIWEAETPPGTWVRAEVRTAADEAGLASAEWVDGKTACSGLCGWVQVRVALGSSGGASPRVSEVRVGHA